METQFTPLASFAGGLLIGLAAVLLMLLQGRIAGATGILSGLVLPAGLAEWAWRAAFVAGMATAPTLFFLASGEWPSLTVPVGTPFLLIGGLLVGLGAALANGCTSGHGVCGLARLQPRSLAATASFMATASATVFVVRHLVGG